MSHPMETGLRKDKKTGEKIPAHYITEVTGEHNGNTVMTANWGVAISKNPYMSFKFKGGAAGDKIKISWVDNKGESDSLEAAIK
jgi:sulfur-oxidizing protein SoxZ